MSRPNIITSPLSRCVSDIMSEIEKHNRVTVCIDRDGDLIVGKADSDSMTTHVARHPRDHVGDYDKRAHSFEVLNDLADRVGEISTFGLARLGRAA